MTTILSILPYPNIDPVIFRLGPVAVRWYGVAYILGFYLGYILLRRLIRTGMLKITREMLGDLLVWLVAGVMVGGRMGWWLFYHHNINASEPWYEPVAIWHGGMSFHGGLIGVAIALAIWSRRRKTSFWNLADAAALVVPVGLFFGRIANFINAELIGRTSTVRWAMIFPGDTIARHPSQLYEAVLEGPTLLLCLWGVKRLRPNDGQIAALFLVLYGVFRFAVEFTREPDSQLGFIGFGWLTMGQFLSFLISLVGVVLSVLGGQRSASEGRQVS